MFTGCPKVVWETWEGSFSGSGASIGGHFLEIGAETVVFLTKSGAKTVISGISGQKPSKILICLAENARKIVIFDPFFRGPGT